MAPIKSSDDNEALFERLCQTVADSRIKTSAGELAVTISIGVAFAAGEGDLTHLLAEADGALYRAKAKGRNRVEYSKNL